MSKLAMRHPEEVQLLQYLDGELPKRASGKVRSHLEACWQCRSELEELQSTVNDCVRYRKQVVIPGMPEPPLAWGSLAFDQVDAEFAGESIFSRLARQFSPRGNAPLRWALSGALALALTVGLVRQLRETPNVEAAALLHRAVAVSDARPHTVKRLRIVTSKTQITRVIGAATKPAAAEDEIASRFSAARYDWKDPLSAQAFAAWHDALARKIDEVISADPKVYGIKTATVDSELISATLKLRKTDLAPVEGRFEFRDHEWVEMTELVDQLEPPASIVAGTAGGRPRQPGVPPVLSVSSPSVAPADTAEAPVVNEELQVVAALHQVGADLGDPVEIGHQGRDIVVSGVGIAPQRQQQIHSVLDRLPHVAVRFSEPGLRESGLPASTPAQGEPAPTRDAVASEKTKYVARLEQRLGGRPQFERFSGQLLDWTDSALSRAYALQRLAQEFPESSESKMSVADRRTLRALGREHLAALQSDLAKIRTTLNPVLTGIGGTASAAEPRTIGVWQPESEQVLAIARRAERLLAAVLGVTSGDASSDVPSQLLTSLGQLTTDIEHCQRLLSYD